MFSRQRKGHERTSPLHYNKRSIPACSVLTRLSSWKEIMTINPNNIERNRLTSIGRRDLAKTLWRQFSIWSTKIKVEFFPNMVRISIIFKETERLRTTEGVVGMTITGEEDYEEHTMHNII